MYMYTTNTFNWLCDIAQLKVCGLLVGVRSFLSEILSQL